MNKPLSRIVGIQNVKGYSGHKSLSCGSGLKLKGKFIDDCLIFHSKLNVAFTSVANLGLPSLLFAPSGTTHEKCCE